MDVIVQIVVEVYLRSELEKLTSEVLTPTMANAQSSALQIQYTISLP